MWGRSWEGEAVGGRMGEDAVGGGLYPFGNGLEAANAFGAVGVRLAIVFCCRAEVGVVSGNEKSSGQVAIQLCCN